MIISVAIIINILYKSWFILILLKKQEKHEFLFIIIKRLKIFAFFLGKKWFN